MNKHLVKIILFFIASSIALFTSCGNKERQFTVQGTVNNADSLTLYLERRGLSDIVILDSVRLTDTGEYSFQQATLDYPEFYRLRLNNQSINFSIDSIETITIDADQPTFSTEYNVNGSYNSKKIKEVVLMQLNFRKTLDQLNKSYEQKLISDQNYLDSITKAIERYKEKASNMILEDYKSTASYFVLFQKIDDMLIFDPTIKKDLNLFRAVATVWDTYYPNSPRTEQLKNYTLKAIKNFNSLQSQEGVLEMLSKGQTIDNKDFFAISLPNINGKEISTTSLKGKIVIVDFTVYAADYSLAHNIRLNQIYEKYKSKLEIYQVSFDNDRHRWSNSAINLPWTCVWDKLSLNSPLIAKFNIENLPSICILDREGNIIKKLSINDDLEKEITKVL